VIVELLMSTPAPVYDDGVEVGELTVEKTNSAIGEGSSRSRKRFTTR
jgi:hypothetical protein